MPESRQRTVEERRAFGRSLRDKCPRSYHSGWKLQTKRDILPLVVAAQAGRIPKLLPHKYQLMAASPFSFYRGSVWLMASDLSRMANSTLEAQICGDAHIRNLGAYAAPDGALVFDLNDFDETNRAPFEWDLKRLAASVELAARGGGLEEKCARAAIATVIEAYRNTIAELAEMPFADLVRYRVRHVEHNDLIHLLMRKAERKSPLDSLRSLTTGDGRTPKFKNHPPELVPVSGKTRALLEAALRDYRRTLSPQHQELLDRYVPVDFAFKMVGTGSVGLRDYVVLLLGNGSQDQPARDPLFLQIKQAVPSAYVPFQHPSAASWHEQGRRVVEGQRKMQTQSDPLLGWTTIDSRDYIVRQLNDHKASLDPADVAHPGALQHFGTVCGAVLARAHSRTADPGVIHGYCGDNEKLDVSLAAFARAYADQVDADYTVFKKLLRQGKLPS